MIVYPNLAAELSRHQISRKEIAEAIGRDPTSVGLILNGKRRLTVETAKKIKDAFFPALSIEFLFSTE